jgi:hypothetical protein
MIPKNLVRTVVGVVLLCVSTAPVFGQAVFGVATSQPPCADIGVTELTGEIALTVLSGMTVAAPFAIEYSAPITNSSAAEIHVSGTLGLAGIDSVPTIDSGKHVISINVPARGSEGSQIHIRGVRVDLAGHGPIPVTATIKSVTTGGNTISAGQGTGPVTGLITAPFKIDLGEPLSFRSGTPVVSSTSFTIREGYVNAFTDSVGDFGQTVPTEIRITPFPEIPKGVEVTLGARATAVGTGATLKTLSGNPVTLPSKSGSTSATYVFTSTPESGAEQESFRILVTMTIDPKAEPAVGSGSITFQAVMLPIGIAVPNTQFPSTAIPRYLERAVPDETELITGSVELAFPFQARQSGTYTGIAITNPLNYRVNVELKAYDANGAVIKGPEITNPVKLIMPRRGQIAKLATEFFGPGFNASTLGTIRAIGNTPVLVGFYLAGEENGTQLDGAVAEVDPINSWVWPTVFHKAPAPFNTYEVFDPGTSTAKAQLSLFDSNGHPIAEGSLTVAPAGTAIRTLEDIFAGIDLTSFEGGYIKGTSNTPLVVRHTFGNVRESNVLEGQVSIQKQSYYLAHFASGGGYESEINFVNVDRSVTAVISLTAIGEDGSALVTSGNPVGISIAPGMQWTRTVADLFPGLGDSLTTGYIRVEVEPYLIGPYPVVPLLTGSLRFSSADGYGSAALPLLIPPASEFIFSHVAQGQGYFTGVAMMNPNPESVTFTLEVFKNDGTLVGSYTDSLQPGEKISKLLYQLVPASGRQLGGYIRVRSGLPVVSFSLFGTDDGLSLSAIPPQQSFSALQ